MPRWAFLVKAGFTRDILVPCLKLPAHYSRWIHYNLLPLLYRNLVGKSIYCNEGELSVVVARRSSSIPISVVIKSDCRPTRVSAGGNRQYIKLGSDEPQS